MSRKRIHLATVVIAAIMLTGGVLAACNSHTERPPAAQAQSLMSNGQRLYLEYCAECHQTDGMGWSTLYPRLAGNPIVTLHDPAPIITTVKYGQGSMMAFGEKLTSDDLGAILTYIRSAWGNHAPPVSPRQVS
jgi:alcohol dehydrogenase (quinone), cytochrome c subunit